MADKSAVIARIREHYGSLGIPLDSLSDREIELGVRQLAEAAREAGTGSEGATEAMRRAAEGAGKERAERPQGEEGSATE